MDYFHARLIRIYVPYLPVGIGMYLVDMLLPGLSESDRSPGLLTSFTLLPSNSPPALSVAWTLVHELIFYGLFLILIMIYYPGGLAHLYRTLLERSKSTMFLRMVNARTMS